MAETRVMVGREGWRETKGRKTRLGCADGAPRGRRSATASHAPEHRRGCAPALRRAVSTHARAPPWLAAGRLERAGRRCAARDGRRRDTQTRHTLRRGCRARLGQRVQRVAEEAGRGGAAQHCRGNACPQADGRRRSLFKQRGHDVTRDLGRCARVPWEPQARCAAIRCSARTICGAPTRVPSMEST